MYLNIMKNKKSGKTTLSIRRGYRDANGKVKNTTIEYLGDLETLKNKYDDPISYFKEVVNQMNQEEKISKQPILIKLDKKEKLKVGTDTLKNFGYVALSKVYHELEIDKFLINKFKDRNVSEFKINNIMKLLAFARCLFPDSKKSTYENKKLFFENTDFTLKEIYNALDEEGYQYNEDKAYKKKFRKCPREITITQKDKNGKNLKIKQNVNVQQVVFWSADYAKRAKAERQPAIDKAKDLIGNVQKYNKKNFRNNKKISCKTTTFGNNLRTYLS